MKSSDVHDMGGKAFAREGSSSSLKKPPVPAYQFIYQIGKGKKVRDYNTNITARNVASAAAAAKPTKKRNPKGRPDSSVVKPLVRKPGGKPRP